MPTTSSLTLLTIKAVQQIDSFKKYVHTAIESIDVDNESTREFIALLYEELRNKIPAARTPDPLKEIINSFYTFHSKEDEKETCTDLAAALYKLNQHSPSIAAHLCYQQEKDFNNGEAIEKRVEIPFSITEAIVIEIAENIFKSHRLEELTNAEINEIIREQLIEADIHDESDETAAYEKPEVVIGHNNIHLFFESSQTIAATPKNFEFQVIDEDDDSRYEKK